MCGRFTLTVDPGTLQESFPEFQVPQQMSPHFNIAPSQPIPVVPNDGKNKVDFFTWGLIPFWADDPKIGNRMINARSETLAEKPSFRAAYRRRRCLVLADGFFEWKKVPGQKRKEPHYIQLKSGDPFAFAGLWEIWHSSDGSEIRSATIITTDPNEMVARLHNRMPVILPREQDAGPTNNWADPDEIKPGDVQHLLTAYPAEEMTHYQVSTVVNNPTNDVPACVEPV